MKTIDTSKYDITTDTYLPNKLGQGHINTVWPSVLQRNRRSLSLAVRSPNRGFRLDWDRVEQELAVRDALQKIGIPVIPTYRLDPKTGEIYETNLRRLRFDSKTGRHDRSRQHLTTGDNLVLSGGDNCAVRYATDYMDAQSIPNARAIVELAHEICQISASSSWEYSHPDAFSILVDRKTRASCLLVGDYKHVMRARSPDDAILINRIRFDCVLSNTNPVLQIPPELTNEYTSKA